MWPMIIHILDQIKKQPLEKGDGAIGIIVAPTRELCKQIYAETKKFSKLQKLRYVCICFRNLTSVELLLFLVE